jgi:integrase
MAVRQRGGSWQVDFMIQGRRVREVFSTQAEGATWELEAKAALMKGLPLPPVTKKVEKIAKERASLGAILDHLAQHHWAKQPLSYKKAMVNVRRVKADLGESTPISNINRERLQEYVEELLDSGNASNTVNRKLSVLSVALGHAEEMGYIARAPRVPFQKPGEKRIRVITPEEEVRIVSLFTRWELPDMVDFTVLGIETGLRLSELLAMEWTSVADDLARWRVEKGKTKAARRTVPLSPAARNALVRLKQRHPGDDGPLTFMRPDMETRWRDVWDRMRTVLKLDDVLIHTMRHTCASRLCAQCKGQSVKLPSVMKWMGHSNVNTTMIYVHPDDDDLDTLLHEREAGRKTTKLKIVA